MRYKYTPTVCTRCNCVEYTIYTLYIIQLTVYKYHNRQHIRNTIDSIKANQVAVYTLYNIHDTIGSVYSILYSV